VEHVDGHTGCSCASFGLRWNEVISRPAKPCRAPGSTEQQRSQPERPTSAPMPGTCRCRPPGGGGAARGVLVHHPTLRNGGATTSVLRRSASPTSCSRCSNDVVPPWPGMAFERIFVINGHGGQHRHLPGGVRRGLTARPAATGSGRGFQGLALQALANWFLAGPVDRQARGAW